MRKTGAGLSLSRLGVSLLWVSIGGVGGTAWGQEVTEGAAPASTEEAAPVDFKAKVQARIDAIQGRSAEEIEQLVLQSEQAMLKLNEEAQAARLAAREMQEKMRLENPTVQAKYREIDELRAKINQFIDTLPEVKAQLDAASQAQERLLEETWFRTAAMGLVAGADRSRGFPERPEPALSAPETSADTEQ